MKYLSTNEKLLMINSLYDYWEEYGTNEDVLAQLIRKIAEHEKFIIPDGEYYFREVKPDA